MSCGLCVLLLLVALSLCAPLVAGQPVACPHSKPSKANRIGCVLKSVDISSSLARPNAVAYDRVASKLIITDTHDARVGVYSRQGRFIKHLNTSAAGAANYFYTTGVDVHGYLYLLAPELDALMVYSPGPHYRYLNMIPLNPYGEGRYYGPAAGSIRVHASEPYLFMAGTSGFAVLAAYKLSYSPNAKHATSISAAHAGSTDQASESYNVYLSVGIDPSNGQVGIIGQDDIASTGSQYIQFYEIDYSDPAVLSFTLGRHLNASNSAMSQVLAYDDGYGADTSNLNIDLHGRIIVSLYDQDNYHDYLIFMSGDGAPLAGPTPSNTGAVIDVYFLQPGIFPTGSIVYVPSEHNGALVFVQGFH